MTDGRVAAATPTPQSTMTFGGEAAPSPAASPRVPAAGSAARPPEQPRVNSIPSFSTVWTSAEERGLHTVRDLRASALMSVLRVYHVWVFIMVIVVIIGMATSTFLSLFLQLSPAARLRGGGTWRRGGGGPPGMPLRSPPGPL
ncbi:unnamed protein product [Prorocentrum cordatum]|uniref:Uncharacterized protein n=1 Tax=Prorocentrum cordatum TaxID=2364126 RepID=A0ABN9TAN8_9DINO|nr:unnamed protein product [Polarella glacialis]